MRVQSAGGVVTMLALAMIGAVLWGGPVTSLWERTFAQPCPARAPSSDCLATLPGRIAARFDDTADADTTLALEIPNAPADTAVAFGYAHAFVTPAAADRLGITGRGQEVLVTLFDTGVVALTGPNGETTQTASGAAEAFLRLFTVSGAAIFLVAGGGYLWRRIRGSEAGWTRRAAASMMVGVLAGMAAGKASETLGARWVMPTTFAVAAVVGLTVAFARLPRVRHP